MAGERRALRSLTRFKAPPATSYGSEEVAIHAAAQYLGLMSKEFDEVVYL